MSIAIPTQGAVAGTPGSPYRAVLSYSAKDTGSYTFTEANFAGLGQYLPCMVFVASGTAANVKIELNTTGSTWVQMGGAGGGLVLADSGLTARITIGTGATDIFLFPLARM